MSFEGGNNDDQNNSETSSSDGGSSFAANLKKGSGKPTSFADKYKKKSDSKAEKFTDQLKNSGGELVYLVRGKDKGRPAWHYVLVEKSKLPIFLKEVDSGSLDVSLYGEVLYSGWGEDPSDDIVQKIKDRFGD